MATRAPRLRGLDYDPEMACQHLRSVEPKLDELITRTGPFELSPVHTQSVFAALAESIVYQQLSGRAAETILGRMIALYHPKRFPGPTDIAETPVERLRGAGLSAAKAVALRDLAARTMDGTVPSMALARRMDDEALIERLTEVRGVGRWTVEMLLIFRLGRPDVLPVTDLGVRKGYARTFRTRGLPTPEAMIRRAKRWRPYRSVASWYLWRALDE